MAQRKLTEPQGEIELPDLTPSQAKYVEGLLSGRMTDKDAYKAAYNTENMGENSISVEAARLKVHPKIALTLAALRKGGLGAAIVTLEGHLQELERLKAIAIETGNVGAAVQAEQLRGKAAGHYVDKIQDVTRENDVHSTLKQIAAVSPDLAQQLASQHGIAWTADEAATKH
jgi:hypothetical protein